MRISISLSLSKDTRSKKLPTCSNNCAVIKITIEREFLAQFFRALDHQVVEQTVWIRCLCEQLPFCSVECWFIVAYITMILEIMCQLLCLSYTEWDLCQYLNDDPPFSGVVTCYPILDLHYRQSPRIDPIHLLILWCIA